MGAISDLSCAVKRIDDKQASQQEFYHYKFSNVDVSEPSKINDPSKVTIDALFMDNGVFKNAMINNYVFQFSPRIVFKSDEETDIEIDAS